MFEITVQTGFAAAHFLRDYPGNCERIHGHNWKVAVSVRAAKLDKLGMGIDFRELKRIVGGTVGELDHRNLNDLKQFSSDNPSAENIARWIFLGVRGQLGAKKIRLARVQVWESEGSSATYQGSGSRVKPACR